MSELSLRSTILEKQYENELLLCGRMLVETAAVLATCSWLPKEAFSDPTLARYWDKVLETGDPHNAASELEIAIDLARAVDTYGYQGRPEVYARRIAEQLFLGKVLTGTEGLAKAIGTGDIDEVQRRLSKLDTLQITGSNAAYTAIDIDNEFREVLRNPHVSVKTRVGSLDAAIGGLFGHELTTFAARPGTGKTALILQIAQNVAKDKKTVLLFSLEMEKVQLWARMACPRAGYQWKDVRAGVLSKSELDEIELASIDVQSRLQGYFYVYDDTYTLQEIHQACIMYKPDLVIIDQLQEIQWHDPSEREIIWYGLACKFLRHYIARNMGVPVLLVAQLSRKVEDRVDKRPVLSDLKWSGEIEQRSDNVWMGYREDYYSGRPSNVYNVPFEIWMRKMRQATANSCVILDYDLQQQWFT